MHKLLYILAFPFFFLTLLFSQDVPQPVNHTLAAMKQARISQIQKLGKAQTGTDYGQYDVHFYDLDLSFAILEEEISGSVLMKAHSLDDNLENIALDMDSRLNVDSLSGDVSAYSHTDDVLRISLDKQFDQNQEFQIKIHYHGSPAEAGYQGLSFIQHGTGNIISSLSEPYFARSWWPCKDIPSDKADSADIRLTVPVNLIPVSNGKLVSTEVHADSTHSYQWEVRYPITTYLISVAISNYEHFEDTYQSSQGTSMPLDYFIYPQQNNQDFLDLIFSTHPMLEFYSSVFGEYPFIKEKYGMATFNWGGAMEHQTISSMGFYNIPVIAHELAHQWWGNMVTTRNWQHIWLNEGFATYSEALLIEEWYGEDEYHRYMDNFAYKGPGTVFVRDTTKVSRIFDADLSYAKGAYVLHMLRHVMGDVDFFRALLAYRDQYFMGTAVTENFQRTAETVSGIDLSAFFRQWIYQGGIPQYLYSMQTRDLGDHFQVIVRIEQTQANHDSSAFVMPVDLLFSGESGQDSLIMVQNVIRDQIYTVQLPWEPSDVELDPGNWILKEANQIPPVAHKFGEDLFTEFQMFPTYPNPFFNYTNIYFSLPAESDVTIAVYDLQGKLINTIVETTLNSGPHWFEWEGIGENGHQLSSGIYFLVIRAGRYTAKQKMTLLR